MHKKQFDLGRFSDPSLLILASLANGPKHGYAMMEDIAEFCGTRLEPGTLYAALARLERRGWIEALEAEERRRPYRMGRGMPWRCARPSSRQRASTSSLAPYIRVLAQLEQRGWIAGDDGGERLRRYHITAQGMLVLQQAEAKYQRNQEQQERNERSSGLLGGKEIIMRLVMWMLRSEEH